MGGPVVVLLLTLGAAPPPIAAAATAQSAVERTPNVEGSWVAEPGVVHFHFVHRFTITDPPISKVLNSPTLLLTTGIPGDLSAGIRYASSSRLVAGEPNEAELFARWAPLRHRDAPVDGVAQIGWNHAAESVDGELLLTGALGRLGLMGGVRAFSDFAGGDGRVGWTGGARWRIRPNVALAGDVSSVPGVEDEDLAWGVGLQMAIPTTPHSLSLHATNATTTTLQGASLDGGETFWGFEFTVPITLSRYFGGGTPAARSDARPTVDAPTGAVVEMNNALDFLPDTVRVRAGEQVVWRNTSDLVHTVTGDPDGVLRPENVILPEGARPFDSGDLAPGASFARTFTVAGTYRYVCVPHEPAGMLGVVIVEPG